MLYRPFTTMTKEEVSRIMADIFEPEKITNIQIHTRNDLITCRLYFRVPDKSKQSKKKAAYKQVYDDITLRNPFLFGMNSIQSNIPLRDNDFVLYKQFCVAKGMIPWLYENPYLEEEKTKTSSPDITSVQPETKSTKKKKENPAKPAGRHTEKKSAVAIDRQRKKKQPAHS